MPDSNRHINQAQRNDQFCESQKLCGSKWQEWAIVVLFYASMHYLDAVLAQDASLDAHLQHPVDHNIRRQALAECTNLAGIAGNYLHLYDRSREARYRCIQFPKRYALTLQANFYSPIRSDLRKLLGI